MDKTDSAPKRPTPVLKAPDLNSSTEYSEEFVRLSGNDVVGS